MACDPPSVSPPNADDPNVTSEALLPTRAGPVPDRLTIWPVDDGRYGLDATFQGSSGYQRAQQHRDELADRRARLTSGVRCQHSSIRCSCSS